MTAISTRFTSSFSAATAAVSSSNLRMGSTGPAVTDIQKKLGAAGHPVDVDGRFGPQTRGAVIAFQRAKGLEVDGIVGPQTRAALNSATAGAASSGSTLRQGSTGVAVTELQNKLRAAGLNIDVDGQFGPQTRNAVIAFQRAKGLTVDGIVGPQTWGALNAVQSSSNTTGPTLTLGSRGAAVTELQNRLRGHGYDIEADGIYGPQTRAAVASFQSARGLTVDGITGPQTWAAIGGAAVNDAAPVAPTPAPGNVAGGISRDQLLGIMPNLGQAKADEYLPFLNQAMIDGGITTPERQAMFLAQLAHESGQLRYFEEIASGAAYEGRADLGNTEPGDGVRYKGRGPIQLTGRNNYRAAGEALGVDFINNPQLAATPEWGFKVAVWFWNSRNLSAAADRGDFDYTTYRINGGYNGNADRHQYWEKAKSVLGVTSAPVVASSTVLRTGSIGTAVTELQNKLNTAGYTVDVDGQFGPQTREAVLRFQKDKGLTADGVVGPQTWAALDGAQSTPQTPPAPAQTTTGPVLKQGASGAPVSELQNRLKGHGYSLDVDGQFGPQTRAAVIAFQQARGLTADGIVGPQTWAAIGGAPVTGAVQTQTQTTTGPMLQQGSSGDPVTELQNRLRGHGYSLSADGQFGPQTRAAVIAFQQARGLTADGIVGPQTWAAIGGAPVQGTSIAGVNSSQALANAAWNAAMGMGGYSSQGLCATGVSRAIRAVRGYTVWGNGNDIDNNLPRSDFKQIYISLEEALKIPGLVLTWEKTSTAAGSIYGHTAITLGDGRGSASDFVERNTLAAEGGRYGLKIFMPLF